VILFLISYNKLCPIEVHRGFKFFSYADDFTILKKIHKNVTMFINSLFTDIISWCDYSGAKLSVQKFKHLHICRKHRCNFTITSQAYSFNQANSLKILVLTISRRYRWKDHIYTLAVELSKRINIIKWLGNRRYNCDTRSLINTINALVISKIDYCLPFYGNCPISCLRKLKTIYHAALRLAIGAPRTTPINNLLIEADITPIEIRLELTTARICKVFSFAKNTPLQPSFKR